MAGRTDYKEAKTDGFVQALVPVNVENGVLQMMVGCFKFNKGIVFKLSQVQYKGLGS